MELPAYGPRLVLLLGPGEGQGKLPIPDCGETVATQVPISEVIGAFYPSGLTIGLRPTRSRVRLPERLAVLSGY